MHSDKNSRSQILSSQDVCKGEILWYMDAEKVSLLTEKNELWTVTQGQRSNHKEQLASIAWSPGRAPTTELGTSRLVLWFNTLRGTGEPEADTVTCEKATELDSI